MSAHSILLRAINLGRQGRFKIAPEFLSISATDNCNLECVMCPGHAGKSGSKMTLEEAAMLFRSLAGSDVNWGRPRVLDMTAGEPTLNPNLASIYTLFKKMFPGAKISMMSNATLPIRGRTREAFELTDWIGISMDGATKETYERIRGKSVFENVIQNVKDVAGLKIIGFNCESLKLMFVAMDQNIHELPAMVRLAHELGIPGLFAQVAEVRQNSPFNFDGQNISLTKPNVELAPYIIEAKHEARRLGIDLSLTSQLEDVLRYGPTMESAQTIEKAKSLAPDFNEGIKFCSLPWFNAPRISQHNNNDIYPTTVCCHMPHSDRSGNMKMRTEFVNKSIGDIFNSEFYWNIRAGLLDGSLAEDACQDCQYYRMTQWTFEQLQELESALNALDSSTPTLHPYSPNVELKESRYGSMLYPLKGRINGNCIEEYARFGINEVELFARLISPGAVVLDVGASIGSLTVPLAQMVGSDGVVVAFEPEPTLHKILCANLVLNSIPNVITYAMVLGHCEGDCQISTFNRTQPTDFWGRPTESGEKGETVPVVKRHES
jgi:MoaA/NifB/PqqE/SkfB family radical SAM enzyme